MKKNLLLLIMAWLFLLPAGLRAQSSSCPAPTNITVSNITETTADVSWDKPGGGEWSHVTYSRHADLSSGNSLYPTGTSSVHLTGLSAGTTYYFRIEYECPGYIHSPWSDIISFTTAGLLPCPIPTNITASNVSSTSAVLSWSQPGSANEWQIAFRPSYENSPSTWLCQDTTYSFTGLSPNTTYCVMLTARCGGNGGSPWSNEVCFTTTSGGNNVSLVEVGQFDQSVPELPIKIQCNYSLSEQIYTAAEIGRSGEIHSIGFFNISDTITRNIDIYLVHTNKNSFSSGSDWTAVTATDRVFSGNVTFNKNDWTLIEFNTPFAYNGTDNLMLVVDDNTGDFNAHNYYFKSFYTQNQAIYSYNDYYPGSDIDPATNISGSRLSTKNYILLGFGMKQCQTPQNLTVSCNNQQHNATLTWDCNPTDFYVEYKKTT